MYTKERAIRTLRDHHDEVKQTISTKKSVATTNTSSWHRRNGSHEQEHRNSPHQTMTSIAMIVAMVPTNKNTSRHTQNFITAPPQWSPPNNDINSNGQNFVTASSQWSAKTKNSAANTKTLSQCRRPSQHQKNIIRNQKNLITALSQ